MLAETKMLSVNQLTAQVMLMESWKAREFKVPHLGTLLNRERNDSRHLRSDSNEQVSATVLEPFAMNSAKLWNLSSVKFRKTNLVKNAKLEARTLVQTLPI